MDGNCIDGQAIKAWIKGELSISLGNLKACISQIYVDGIGCLQTDISKINDRIDSIEIEMAAVRSDILDLSKNTGLHAQIRTIGGKVCVLDKKYAKVQDSLKMIESEKLIYGKEWLDELKDKVDQLSLVKNIQQKHLATEYHKVSQKLDGLELRFNVLNENSSSARMFVSEPIKDLAKAKKATSSSKGRLTPKKDQPKIKADKTNKILWERKIDTLESSQESKSVLSDHHKNLKPQKHNKNKSSKQRATVPCLPTVSMDAVTIRVDDRLFGIESDEKPRSHELRSSIKHKSRQHSKSKDSYDGMTSRSHRLLHRHADSHRDRHSALSRHDAARHSSSYTLDDCEVTLILDDDGYLMRQNGEYLTDDYGQKVKLTNEHLESLKMTEQYSEVEA